MNRKFVGAGAFIVLLSIAACQKEATDTTDTSGTDCSTLTLTYTNDIKAIVDKSCALSGCHNATSKADGINLSTYALVKSESAKARFMGSIRHSSGYHAMPQGSSKLDAATIQKLDCWIQNGQLQ